MSAEENKKVPFTKADEEVIPEVKDLTGKKKFIVMSFGKQEAIIAAIGVAVGMSLSFLISRVRDLAEEEESVEITAPSVTTSKS